MKNIVFVIRRFRNWISIPFWMFQEFLFGIFVVGGLGQLVYNMCTGGSLKRELSNIIKVTEWWMIAAGFTTLLWIIAREVLDLDLWLYYYVWINQLAPILYGNQPKYQRFLDIKGSFEPQRLEDNKEYPTFIRREHLMRKEYWPDWEFSIVTIFQPHKVRQVTAKTADNGQIWRLEVDLRNESFGIYNNAGKRFLARRFEGAITSEHILGQSLQFHNFMLPSTHPGRSLTWGEIGESIPLRWASGGFLPIVQYNNKRWALLFFRDIPLHGLNIANGASENKEEYKKLNRLIGREFSEETILLSSRPYPERHTTKRDFVTFTIDPKAPSSRAPIINPEFADKHKELRFRHDAVSLSTSLDFTREVKSIHTPFFVRVTYHQPDLKESVIEEIPNVICSLNPTVFGIEVVWLCTFKLEDGEYLIDGEYHLSREFLIRRPIILLDMEFLHQIYAKENTLGELLTESNRSECKQLPPVPKQHCVIFDADIGFRENRLGRISKGLNNPSLSQKERGSLEWERDRIESWLSLYKQAFEEAKNEGLQDEHLRTLCPVTWKALELIFAHQINYHV